MRWWLLQKVPCGLQFGYMVIWFSTFFFCFPLTLASFPIIILVLMVVFFGFSGCESDAIRRDCVWIERVDDGWGSAVYSQRKSSTNQSMYSYNHIFAVLITDYFFPHFLFPFSVF
jgi:hypothetical protein